MRRIQTSGRNNNIYNTAHPQQNGEGFADLLKKLPSMQRMGDLATGEIGTALRNMIPSSDSLARPGYPGEKHAILRLPNGRFGVANYMGPGTQIEKRLMRGDPPRTMSDKVAQAHDIRYGLGTSHADVRRADELMIKKLKSMLQNKEGDPMNINLGLRPIQAKVLGEKSGLLKKDQFASFGGVKNKTQLKKVLKGLEQDGFGLGLPGGGGCLPGDRLRLKMRAMGGKEKKSLKGRGVSVKSLAMMAGKKILPCLLKQLQGQGLKLAGQGLSGSGDLKGLLHMQMLKKLNTGVSRDRKNIVGTGADLKKVAKGAAEVLLPLLFQLAQRKLQGKGVIRQADIDNFKPGLLDKLGSTIFSAFGRMLKRKLFPGKQQKGEGSFWKDFGKGFVKGFTETMKVGLPLVKLLI